MKDRWVFHGTRNNQPARIWQEGGFDLRKARIGGCLWFADQSNYSMSSFAHTMFDGKSQVFLCCMAEGDTALVKPLHRTGGIWNVFRSEAVYPAYLITFSQ